MAVTKQLMCPNCGAVLATDVLRRWPGKLVAFLENNVHELVFDISCRNGHSIVRTTPQIARAIRSAPGPLVDLSR